MEFRSLLKFFLKRGLLGKVGLQWRKCDAWNFEKAQWNRGLSGYCRFQNSAYHLTSCSIQRHKDFSILNSKILKFPDSPEKQGVDSCAFF